jgi:hypothetical protein
MTGAGRVALGPAYRVGSDRPASTNGPSHRSARTARWSRESPVGRSGPLSPAIQSWAHSASSDASMPPAGTVTANVEPSGRTMVDRRSPPTHSALTIVGRSASDRVTGPLRIVTVSEPQPRPQRGRGRGRPPGGRRQPGWRNVIEVVCGLSTASSCPWGSSVIRLIQAFHLRSRNSGTARPASLLAAAGARRAL